MKKLLILVLFATALQAQAPKWFGNAGFVEPEYMIIGYGEAEDLEKAKNLAKDDISKSIRTTIKSSFTSNTRVAGGDVDKHVSQSIEAKNSMTLTNVQEIKKEQVAGRWYVAMKYDNRPIEQKLAEVFSKDFCVQKTKTHPYIVASPLYRKIKQNLGCDIDISIIRHNKMWQIRAFKDAYLPMAPLDFEKLFFNRSNPKLKFHSNKQMLKNGDEFLFDATSADGGYITLMTMYEDGIVTVLEPSKRVSKNKKILLPSPEREMVLEAATLQDGSATFDLYIALYSKAPLDMSRYEYASEELASSENAYKFDELLDLMQVSPYSTIRLTTKPR